MVRSIVVLLVVLLATSKSPSLHASDLPRQLQAGPHRLVLNGVGTRSNLLIDLYKAGLYLSRPSRNPQEIMAADEAMAIHIEITSSFVSQEKLVNSLTEGFEKATAGRTASIQTEIAQFRNCLRDSIAKGDVFDLVYVPQHGVIVNKNGKLTGVVAGLEFKRALFGIWLSEHPADSDLKQALLNGQNLR